MLGDGTSDGSPYVCRPFAPYVVETIPKAANACFAAAPVVATKAGWAECIKCKHACRLFDARMKRREEFTALRGL